MLSVFAIVDWFTQKQAVYAEACEQAYDSMKNVMGYCTKRRSLVALPGMIEIAPGDWPSPCPSGASLIGSGVSLDFSIRSLSLGRLLGVLFGLCAGQSVGL